MSLHYTLPEGFSGPAPAADGGFNLTAVVIHLTMFVGMPTITQDNLRDFARRARIYGATWLEGAMSVEDLEPYVGLETNASPLSWAEFLESLPDEAEAAAKRDALRRASEAQA
jgi:hypothetical protein